MLILSWNSNRIRWAVGGILWRLKLRENQWLSFILFSAVPSIAYDDFTEEDVAALLSIRPIMFGGSSIQASLLQWTINGSLPPIFGYSSSDRAIISWKVKNGMEDAFARAIGLPPEMSLCKVAPITTTTQRDCLDRDGTPKTLRKRITLYLLISQKRNALSKGQKSSGKPLSQ